MLEISDVFAIFFDSETWVDFLSGQEVSGFQIQSPPEANFLVLVVYYGDGSWYISALDRTISLEGMEEQAIHRAVADIHEQREEHQKGHMK